MLCYLRRLLLPPAMGGGWEGATLANVPYLSECRFGTFCVPNSEQCDVGQKSLAQATNRLIRSQLLQLILDRIVAKSLVVRDLQSK